MTVIVNYAPVEGADSAEEHYSDLANAINGIPKHNLLVFIGDFEAYLGRNDSLFSYHENTNNKRSATKRAFHRNKFSSM